MGSKSSYWRWGVREMRALVVSDDLTEGTEWTPSQAAPALASDGILSTACKVAWVRAEQHHLGGTVFNRFLAHFKSSVSAETPDVKKNFRNTQIIQMIVCVHAWLDRGTHTRMESGEQSLSMTRGRFLIIPALFSSGQDFTCKPPKLHCKTPPFRLQREQSNSINSSCWEKGRPFPGAIHNIWI